MKANPIPPQYSRWGRFNELAEHNQKVLREILDDSAAHHEPFANRPENWHVLRLLHERTGY